MAIGQTVVTSSGDLEFKAQLDWDEVEQDLKKPGRKRSKKYDPPEPTMVDIGPPPSFLSALQRPKK